MNDLQIIKQSILKITKQDDIYSLVCVVSDIDLDNYTCICKPVNGSATLVNVRLMASNSTGFKVIPKDGSEVLVTLINQSTGYVAMCSEIDLIELNGDNEEGLVKVNDLVTKLNNLENLVNNILNTLKSTSIPLAPSGTYPFAPLYTALTTITPITQKTDLENTKVKHGSS